MTSNYTYQLNSATVNPAGEWNFEYRRNTGQIFWRLFINGEFIFQGDDYQTIMGMSDCDILDFEIFCNGESVWTGEFKHPYGWSMVDEDSCIISGTPDLVDEYSCIMDMYEHTWYYNRLRHVIGGTSVQVQPCGGGGALATLQLGHTLYEYIDSIINLSDSGYGMNCGLTLRSSFLWRDNFENGDNYAAYYGVNNYVTGATNRLEYIYFWDNDRVIQDLGGAACDNSFMYYDFRYGWKLWEEFLRERLNAYWYIDSNGDFRVEHISHFLPGFAHSSYGSSWRDLTALYIQQTGKSYAYRRNKYSYITDVLFDQERWEWAHYHGTEGGVAHDTNFAGEPIYYGAAEDQKSDCVPGDFKERVSTLNHFWSDVEWATGLAAPASTLECQAWLFCDVNLGAPNVVRCETGLLTAANKINAHCSTANLMEHYNTWDRVFLTGTMNGGDVTPVTTFDSAKRKKLQKGITVPICCIDGFDGIQGVTTEMGIGLINNAEIDQKSITFQLEYE